jgi:hypothetical protein
MPYSKSTWLVIAVAAVIILAAGIALALRAYRPVAQAPLFTLDLWQGEKALHGQMMLRREAEGSGALLIRHSERPTVYAYDPAKRSLTPADEGAWERAAGAVAECEAQAPPPYSVLHIDPETHRLLAGSREVGTAGKTALVLRASPSGRRAAVLSATGSIVEGILPFSGGSGASGQYLHQTLSLPEATPVGATVGVPVRRSGDSLTPCWSADERFVVYYHVLFFYLSIVEADPPSTPRKVSP